MQRLEDANPKVFATIPGANEVVLQLWAKLKEVLGGRYTRAGKSPQPICRIYP